ncbi:MAG: flagellar biosynthetic protein FliP, partial [Steroidobacteraceae bacterium]
MKRRAQRRLGAAAMLLLTVLALLPLAAADAQGALPALAIKTAADGAQTYSLTFQVLILMTVLTL